MKTTVHCKLVAQQHDFYTVYVFQNLDEVDNSLLRYISATRPPNWNGTAPDIGDCGFAELEYVDAGEEYYERNTGNKETYKYNQCYFLNFVKDKNEEIVNNKYQF